MRLAIRPSRSTDRPRRDPRPPPSLLDTAARAQAAVLTRRLSEPRRFIQVMAGPRQVGKTTLVQQVTGDLALPVHFASADVVPPMLACVRSDQLEWTEYASGETELFDPVADPFELTNRTPRSPR